MEQVLGRVKTFRRGGKKGATMIKRLEASNNGKEKNQCV